MEDNYVNDMSKSSPNHPGPLGPRAMGTGRRWVRPALFGLGLLCVLLLARLLVLGIQYYNMVQDLSVIQSELTERQKVLCSLVEERNQQNSSLPASLKQQFDTLLMHCINMTQTCPEGWKKFESACYHHSDKNDSWENSRLDCMQRGGDLVVVDSAQKQKFLSEYDGSFWIGLSDLEQEGTWKWVDGSSLTLSYWENFQPDNGVSSPLFGEEDCAHFKPNNYWNDVSCGTNLHWICEKTAEAAQISMA